MKVQKGKDLLVVLCFTVISLAAVLVVPGLRMEMEFSYAISRSAAERELYDRLDKLFPDQPLLVVAFDDPDGILADTVYEILRVIPGVNVMAPESLKIPTGTAADLSTASLAGLPSGPERIEAVDRLLDGDPFLSRLFRSLDGRTRLLLICGDGTLSPANFMDHVIAAIPPDRLDGLHFWGEPYFLNYQRRQSLRDALFLIPAGAVAALVLHVILTRHLAIGICLWLVSLVPALWVMALYPLTGTLFRVDSILVPIEILALATSYAIQFHRHVLQQVNRGQGTGSREIRPVILMSGGTTILGFMSLFTISLQSIQGSALYIILGILCAMAAALLLLPAVFRLLNLWCIKVPGVSVHKLSKPVPGPGSAVIITALICLAAFGIPGVRTLWPDTKLFVGNNELNNNAAYYQSRFGGMDQVHIVIDTDRPYFFIEPVHHQALKSLTLELEADERLSMVISAPQFMEWTFQRLYGSDSVPDSIEALGEIVEMAGGSEPGLSIATLLGAESSIARILVRFTTADFSTYDQFASAVTAKVESAFPDATIRVTGATINRWELKTLIARGILAGLVSFMPTLFFFFLFYFRSIGLAIQIILPPSCALMVYFGLIGWLGYSLDIVTAIGAAMVMGVGVDDVIHLLITARNAVRKGLPANKAFELAIATAGLSIIQTTLIICVGLCVLFFSVFRPMVQTGLLSILSLGMATAVTLAVIPVLPFGLRKKPPQ